MKDLRKKSNSGFLITAGLLVLIFALLSIFSSRYIYNSELDNAAMRAESNLVTIQSLQLNDINIFKTLVYQLAQESELQRYIMRPNDLSKSFIENNWMLMQERVGWISQIRFISNSGFEILRVDYDREDNFARSIENRQNKQNRHYFKQAKLLDQNEIYISPITLNREYNELSYPLTPVIHMAMKVYQPSGQSSGILVVNYYADKLISTINDITSSTPGSSLFLDESGHYLQGHKPEQDWSYEVRADNPDNFSENHAEAWSKITRQKQGNIKTDDDRFVFRQVKYIDNSDDVNSYYIVQHISAADIRPTYKAQQTNILLLYVSLFIILLLIAWQYFRNRLIKEIDHLSLELISALFYSNEAVFITDDAWNIQIVNDAFCKTTGYDITDTESMQCGQICFLDNPLLESEFKKSLNDNGEWQGEVECQHKNGNNITAIVHASAIRNRKGKTSRYVVQLIDITERKRMENDLKVSSVAFETRSAITITDQDGNIMRVNKAFTEITGYEPHEVVGKNPNLLSSGKHDTQFYKQLWGAIEEKGSWQGEIWNKHKDGKIYPEWINISSIKDETGQVIHYVATFEDITERKQLEEQIKSLS
jgi:PAS domain S-box-containing protein